MTRDAQTVPIRFVNDLISNVSHKPEFRPDCIDRAGIAQQLLKLDGARITMEKFSELYRLVAVDLDDETPGLFSRPSRNGTLKFLCLSMMDAPSLQVALHRFRNFFRLINDDVYFHISQDNDLVCIALYEQVELGQARILASELLLMLVQGVSSWMIGRKIPFQRIDFAFSRPAHASEYEQLYPGPTYFDQPCTALYMDPMYMDQPIRRDKTALRAFLHNSPMDWFYISDSDRPYTHHLREYLKGSLDQGLTVADAAQALHISPRTLARRLVTEGSSFQHIKDTLRRDVAIEQLNKTTTSVAAIGTSLGFEDPATFSRAFRQWTGSAPGAYRKQPRGTNHQPKNNA